MKLYFSRGTCSLSPLIALQESGLPFATEAVDLKSKRTASGADYMAINPKGYVPALAIEQGDGDGSGNVLTEGPAIVQFIADRAPDKNLAPKAGTYARSQLQEWLNFIGTEIHKQFSPFFNPKTPDDYKAGLREKIGSRLSYIEKELRDKPYLLGENLSVADAYLFAVLQWAPGQGIDLKSWPKVTALLERMKARPGVKAAIEAEKAPAPAK